MKKKKLQVGNIQDKSPKFLSERAPRKATKSFDEEGIPSNRVAPGAPNPPMYKGGKVKRKKSKMRHGQY